MVHLEVPKLALSSMTLVITSSAAAAAGALTWGVSQADAHLRLILQLGCAQRGSGTPKNGFRGAFLTVQHLTWRSYSRLLLRVGQGAVCDKIVVMNSNFRVCARAFNSVTKKNLTDTVEKTLG